jgi:hypothetical protein
MRKSCGLGISWITFIWKAEKEMRFKAMNVFWDVAPCNLVDIYQRFKDAYCLRHEDDGCINLLTFRRSLMPLLTGRSRQ